MGKLNEIHIGDIILLNNTTYRILDMNEKRVVLIQMGIRRLDIAYYSTNLFKDYLRNSEIQVVQVKENELPVEKLSEKDKEDVERKAACLEEMLQEMYPNWDRIQMRESKPAVDKLKEQLHISSPTVFKMIRKYLQSGRNQYSLLDERKKGNNRNNDYKIGDTVRGHGNTKVLNDERLREIFEEGFQYYCKGAECGITLKAAYEFIIQKYYSKNSVENGNLIIEPLPPEECPSYKRFWIYATNQNGGEGIRKLRNSDRERRNNERLLLGTSQSGCLGPGHIVEIDEVELDMVNVSANDRRQIVGRSVVYMAVDVYSTCIVGCWVDYDNNSFVGLTNLLMSMFCGLEEEFSSCGIVKAKEVCPHSFLPLEIRVDQGSEYTSGDARRIALETGMSVTLVAPGTGSLKGIVEQIFHQLQEELRAAAFGTGIILKKYGSKHYETACTDIFDTRKIVYQFVEKYNHTQRKGYPMTLDMMNAELIPTPMNLWEFGCQNISMPRWILPGMLDNLVFSLLKNDKKFTVSRRGLNYQGLYYDIDEEWFRNVMRRAGNQVLNYDGIRYDPRSINTVYKMMDGKLIAIPLNELRAEQGSFLGMTWNAYDECLKAYKKRIHDHDQEDQKRKLNLRQNVSKTIAKAKREQETGKNIKKNIRDARRSERESISIENTVEQRMGLNEEKQLTQKDEGGQAFNELLIENYIADNTDDDTAIWGR